MPTYNPSMQKARLADLTSDVHGLISKRSAELDGVTVTGVTFGPGDVMLLPPGHDAWTVGTEPCTFVEFSRGNDYYA
jgi:hypothetical protein